METKNSIALGADHGGWAMKEAAKKMLDEAHLPYTDFGCHTTESVNYPDYANAVCQAIQNGTCDCGILFCGTGIGMSMAANKHRGIRAACCTNEYMTRMTRLHNNANVLCLGGRVLGEDVAMEMIRVFLETDFMGGRHQTRIDMLDEARRNDEG